MIELNETNFDELVVNSRETVLVELGAGWCAPCQRLKPILEALSKEMQHVKFYEVDIDDNPELSKHFGIKSVPMMLIFKDGLLINSIVGLVSKAKIQEALDV